MLIVHNLRPHATTIAGPYVPSVEGDGRGSSFSFQIFLKPGANVVDPNEWNKVKGNEGVQRLLAPEKIKTRRKGRFATTTPCLRVEELKAESFDKLDTAAALKLVEETNSRDLLEEWLNNDTRGKVKQALQEKLEDLLSPFVQEIGTAIPEGAKAQKE